MIASQIKEGCKMPDSEAKKKWIKDNTVFIGLKLQKKTDADILAFLDGKPKQTTIKTALREYITTITTPAKGEKGQSE